MARSKERRKRHRPRRPTPPPGVGTRHRNIQRAAIAFLILIGLAGILAVSAPDGDPAGGPAATAPRSHR
jgi:hypothetical protein